MGVSADDKRHAPVEEMRRRLLLARRLGMEKDEPVRRFITKLPSGRFTPASGEGTVCGLAVDVDEATGLARAVAPLALGGVLEQRLPPFWG